MPFPLRCRCGQVRGEIDAEHAFTRATCHCRDCQSFARFLGRDDIVDAHGGTDIAPMAPAKVRFTSGSDQVACMSLGPKGLLRWYAACCRTPIGNTGREPKMPYVGVVTDCIDAPDGALDAALGPRDRIMLFRKEARGEVKATPVAFALGGLSILLHVTAARLRGRRESPFFDADDAPVRQPQVLTKAERTALEAERAG